MSDHRDRPGRHRRSRLRVATVMCAVTGTLLVGTTAPATPAAPATSAPDRFWDPAPPAGTRTPATAGSGVPRRAVSEPAYPLSQTFRLHSLPGSAHTIYLDFDGGTVAGTQWNAPDPGLADGAYPGWDLDGDPGLGPLERAAVQSVWQRVAEDFAPFDVDVTTEEPPPGAISRDGVEDPTYGTWVLVSDSKVAMRTACPVACSGSAFSDVFDRAVDHDLAQPAWVFPRAVGDSVKDVGDVVSHEVGHTFGLGHDGTSTDGYYGGHGSWAPIMGAGYGRPVTQWSRGDYADASNHQDDLAVIAANGAPLRADDAPGTVDAAAPLTGSGLVTDDADVDVFDLGSCGASVTVVAQPAPVSPDLDLQLRLLRPDGSRVARRNPLSARLSGDRASGMGARIAATVAPGHYLVAVTGVGNGDPVTGYDGYASLGRYSIAQAGCTGG